MILAKPLSQPCPRNCAVITRDAWTLPLSLSLSMKELRLGSSRVVNKAARFGVGWCGIHQNGWVPLQEESVTV